MQRTKIIASVSTLTALIAGIAPLGLSSTAFAQSTDVTLAHTVTDINGGSVEIGDTLRFQTDITNVGSTTPAAGSFLQKIPAGTEFVAGSLLVNGAPSDESLTGTKNAQTFTKTIQSLEPGTSQVISYDVVIEGSPLYFVDNSAKPPILYELDKTTGAASYVGRMEGQKSVYGLGLSADGYSLYGVNGAEDVLVRYDLHTGITTEVGPINMGNVGVPCLDFDANDVLYAGDARGGRLIALDTATGAGVSEQALDVPIKGGDCAFGADGQAYFVSNTNNGKGALWVVNPATGEANEVANISDTEFFTGLALGVNGQLFASGNNSDSLWSIDPATGVGTEIGAFGVPHNGGDLAMTAGQKLVIRSVAEYTDGSNEDVTSVEAELQGDAPTIGGGGDIGPDLDLSGPQCPADETNCVLAAEYDEFVGQYLIDVVGHHFSGVELTAGEQVNIRSLSDQALVDYLEDAQGVILTHRADAQAAGQALIEAWKAEYNGDEGKCPHINQLLMDIREELTKRQAIADVAVKQIYDYHAQSCSVVAQDSTIRIGDEVTLAWDSHGVTNVQMHPFIGAVPTRDGVRVTPAGTMTYDMVMQLDDGSEQKCSYDIVVETACDINSFAESVPLGGGTRLLWSAEGNASASISGIGDVDLDGYTEVYPTETTTYTMTIFDASGNEIRQCDRTIEVYDPATCTE